MKVRLVDLRAEYEEIRGEVELAIRAVIESSRFILGPAVERFEAAFAEAHGARHCVGVASGTDALRLTIEALGIGSGDEVIMPVNTFAATALAVSGVGARPRFVDCDERTYLIGPDQVGGAVGRRTRAILPVHLYGRMLDVSSLEVFGIPVIEDAAQAHGASLRGAPAGSVGIAGCFSFYPSKNLGAWGDGGAVVTSDDDLVTRLVQMRNLGEVSKYHHEVKGYNSRLDALQAAVLHVKLSRLEEGNRRRCAAARFYNEHIKDGIPRPDLEGVFHLYVIRVADRERLRERLAEVGIETGVHYPIPLHLQGAFRDLGHVRGEFPVAEQAAGQLLSLPIYPQIGEGELSYVVENVNRLAMVP